jgi:hypothetical protein
VAKTTSPGPGILSFDASAPPSDMDLFSRAETRQEHEEHWRETADFVENNEQHVSSKKAIASHISNRHESGGDAE